jgi:hypothetical protein
MCLLLYLGADRELPLTDEGNADRPAFHVSLLPDISPAIQHLLNTRYVYYVGSHEGCGCGFGYESTEEFNRVQRDLCQAVSEGMPEDNLTTYQEDRTSRINCMNNFREYLTKVTSAGPVKLLVTWADELDDEITQVTVTPEFFGGDRCVIREKFLFDIKHS